MKTSPAYKNWLNVPQWRPHFFLTLLLAAVTSACGGGGGGGGGETTPPPTSALNSGAVYVFTPDAAAAFAQQAYIKASNTDAEDRFGWSVIGLSGDTLAVGAFLEDSIATGIASKQNGNSAIAAVAVYAFGGGPNTINLKSNDVIPMAVLGSVIFDATQVDFSTAVYGPGRASPLHDGHVEDVNHDGFFDKLFHFNTQDTDIACGDTDATLSGQTFGRNAFTGTASVRTAGCQ